MCRKPLSTSKRHHSVTLIASEMGPFSCRQKGCGMGKAFPLHLREQGASSHPERGVPSRELDFWHPFNATCGHALPRQNQKTAKRKPAPVMATKSPKHQPTLRLRRSPVPDLWLLKCQRYLRYCTGGEEGLRRANPLHCNSDLTLRVALGSSTSLCASHHS